MRLEHAFTVPAPVEEVWTAFNDLERVVPCFPGATLTSFDGDAFEGSCKVKLGPISLLYTGTGHFVERDPGAHSAVIEAKGKDRRGNGTASARVTAHLSATGDSSTAVTVGTDLTVTGRPAQFGRGLMQEVSDKLLWQFVDCLTDKLGTTAPAAAATAGPAAGTPGAAPGPATGTPTTGGPEQVPAAGHPTEAQPPAGETATETSTGKARTGKAPTEAPAAELDLGSTLLPMLARRMVPYLIGAALALLIRRLLRR